MATRVPRAAYASLLDDPRFVADLERVDFVGPPAVECSMALPVQESWNPDPEPVPAPSAQWAFRQERCPAIVRVAIGVAGFLMMMGVGGAAAAYVFADRIAMILGR
jgi:hypothetical protein